MNLDPHVASAKKIHVTIAILALTVCYFSWIEYQRKESETKLNAIEFILGLRDVTENFETSLRPLHNHELPNYLGISRDSEALKSVGERILWSDGGESNTQRDVKQLQSQEENKPIQGAFIAESRELGLRSHFRCTYAVFKLSNQAPSNGFLRMEAIDQFGARHFLYVSPDNAYFVTPSVRCALASQFLNTALLIDARKEFGSWFIGLDSAQFSELFPPEDKAFADVIFGRLLISSIIIDKEVHLNGISKYFVDHALENLEYKYLSVSEFENHLLDIARSTTGKTYNRTIISNAINDIFLEKTTEANLFGIRTSHIFFIKIAPIFLSAFLYVFYRRLRHIYIYYSEFSEPWLFAKIDNKLDLFISAIWATSPVVLSILLYWLYADVTGTGLKVFGYSITPRMDMVPDALFDAIGASRDYDLASSFVFSIFILNLYFIIMAEFYLIKIIFRYRIP